MAMASELAQNSLNNKAEDFLTMLNTSLLWKIPKFSEYNCTMEISSPPFVLESDYHQYKMRLFLYPETDSASTNSALEVELSCCNEPLYTVQFSFSIINDRGIKSHTMSVTSEKKVEFITSIHDYLNIDAIKNPSSGLLVQDKLRILCEMKTLYTEPSFSMYHEYKPQKTYELFFENDKFSDVTIIDEVGTRIPAHKLLLSVNSPVFAGMFEHSMRENNEGTVTITNINSKCLREMLRYLYTGKVDNLDKLAGDLLAAANQYGLDELKEMCEFTLLNKLSVESAITTLITADKHNAVKLKELVVNFITEHAKDVINTPTYKAMESSHIDLVKEVLCAIVLKKSQSSD